MWHFDYVLFFSSLLIIFPSAAGFLKHSHKFKPRIVTSGDFHPCESESASLTKLKLELGSLIAPFSCGYIPFG